MAKSKAKATNGSPSALGMVGGAAAGAAAGSMIGPLGAAVGAIVGGVAGANAKEIAKRMPKSVGTLKLTPTAKKSKRAARLKKSFAKSNQRSGARRNKYT